MDGLDEDLDRHRQPEEPAREPAGGEVGLDERARGGRGLARPLRRRDSRSGRPLPSSRASRSRSSRPRGRGPRRASAAGGGCASTPGRTANVAPCSVTTHQRKSVRLARRRPDLARVRRGRRRGSRPCPSPSRSYEALMTSWRYCPSAASPGRRPWIAVWLKTHWICRPIVTTWSNGQTGRSNQRWTPVIGEADSELEPVERRGCGRPGRRAGTRRRGRTGRPGRRNRRRPSRPSGGRRRRPNPRRRWRPSGRRSSGGRSRPCRRARFRAGGRKARRGGRAGSPSV